MKNKEYYEKVLNYLNLEDGQIVMVNNNNCIYDDEYGYEGKGKIVGCDAFFKNIDVPRIDILLIIQPLEDTDKGFIKKKKDSSDYFSPKHKYDEDSLFCYAEFGDIDILIPEGENNENSKI